MGPLYSANGSEQRPGRPRLRVPFVARILIAMSLGALVGQVFGTRVERLGAVGSVIIDLIKALAGPLLFFAVVDAFLRTHVRARSAALMVGISLTNAAVAVGIGLTLSNVIKPGAREPSELTSLIRESASQAEPPRIQRIDFVRELTSYIPRNVVQPFLENSVITIVVLAIMAGLALRRVKGEQEQAGASGYRVIEDAVTTVFRAIEVVLGVVIGFVPLAVFAVVARTIGRGEFDKFRLLVPYVGVAVLGLALQVFLVYQAWVVLAARMSLRKFWAGARDAVVYALGASSSLATLPVTLRCLDRMGVSPQAARLAACVGTNLNNDGILLYEAMAVLFVAQVYEIPLTFGQQLVAAASCVIAGIGIAAVPDAGLISLALVLATVGLPVEIVPLLLTVDWLLSRCRAVTNVTSDILVAVLLDRFGVRETEPLAEPAPVDWGIGSADGLEPTAQDLSSTGGPPG
jgi:DAACS family dicarboxylate/amino acid:cation (Na+ or H+) symporter